MTLRLRGILVLASVAVAACSSSTRNRPTDGLVGAGPSGTRPHNCLEIQEDLQDAGNPLVDGLYELFVDGDERKPWDAHCHGMNGESPTSFILVDRSGNYSQLSDGSAVTETRYRGLRINPDTLTIDPLDGTLADTRNAAVLSELMPDGRSKLPAGWAQYYGRVGNGGPAAEAHVDLRGTRFVLAEAALGATFFCTTSDDPERGDTRGSGSNVSSDGSSFTLTAINTRARTLTKTVADCEHLGGADVPGVQNFTGAAWPLRYVGR